MFVIFNNFSNFRFLEFTIIESHLKYLTRVADHGNNSVFLLLVLSSGALHYFRPCELTLALRRIFRRIYFILKNGTKIKEQSCSVLFMKNNQNFGSTVKKVVIPLSRDCRERGSYKTA